jgi:dinuclear metal center YbgI/SA1388 family protein
MLRINEITYYLETIAPPVLQESYDNSGLLVGDPDAKVSAALLTIDVTEEVVDEAIEKDAGLIIAHHPVIFTGLKRLTGKNYVERVVLKAVKNDVAIYAAHTNLDAAAGGVNAKICEKMELTGCRILQPLAGKLKKLVTFIPFDAADRVKKALFNAGAGHIGNYDSCGFNLEGTGSFRGNEASNPYIGTKGELHHEKEIRFETIFPEWLQNRILHALLDAHPYEEVAFDIYPLDNVWEKFGMGMIGMLPEALPEDDFLLLLKNVFHTGCIKHTAFGGKQISSVAVCGGTGSFLLNSAIAARADAFVSGDFKYHQFFDADNRIVIADIGHYESEQFTKDLFFELLRKKFPKFALRFSAVKTNPVHYY